MPADDTPDPIYLDHNATTPILPEVVDAMLPCLRGGRYFGNPSSSHVYGQRAKKVVERARGQVAELLGCQPGEIVFTSGGTESNNLAIRGVAAARTDRRHLVTSTVEHPATREPCTHLQDQGWRVSWCSVDRHCRVQLAELEADLCADTALVTVMHANNEVGTIQPIARIAELAHERGALVHTDAAQSVGKVPTRVDELGVDLLSVAGHKLYGPKGVGALYIRRGTTVHPFTLGAGHERGLRPGTEAVAQIVGLGMACEVARADLTVESRRQRDLRDRLWQQLHQAIPGVELNGHLDERLPNTLNVRFPGVSGAALLESTPEVAATTGSACHEGEERPSAVLLAMGIEPPEALGAVRLSLGRATDQHAVDRTAAVLIRSFRRRSSDGR